MFKVKSVKTLWNDIEIKIETGILARQAHGAATVTLGETTVLCAVVIGEKVESEDDFLALSVFYHEKFYAAGKIPGGFVKREGKPTEKETLVSRLIDRALRPLIKINENEEVQITCTVLSYDDANSPEIAALIGASAAIKLAGINCDGTVGVTRIGYISENFIMNPNAATMKDSAVDLLVAGTADHITMVECSANELSKDVLTAGFKKAQESISQITKIIDEFVAKSDIKTLPLNKEDDKTHKLISKSKSYNLLVEAISEQQKQKRHEKTKIAKEKILKEIGECEQFNTSFEKVKINIIRENICNNKRLDGRTHNAIREISCDIDILPRVHGSALFTRGETQVLAVVTIGGKTDFQMAEDVAGVKMENFMLHYNFPSYSVGEIGIPKGISRREIGHGKLAMKAIAPLLPTVDEYSKAIRVVADVTESNGSSSMATICASSLALMASGVPLKKPVAGIAMGLIKSEKSHIIISDIMGDEDKAGDMDFKVAGTKDGITALQMDIKVNGLDYNIIEKAIEEATKGIDHILGKMNDTISIVRDASKTNGPKSTVIQIGRDNIKVLIGPGGKTIKEISFATKSKIDIGDDGATTISAPSQADIDNAIERINKVIIIRQPRVSVQTNVDESQQVKIGEIHQVKVVKVGNYGVSVELENGAEGFIHISDLFKTFVENIHEQISEGHEMKAKVIGFDRNGKIKLKAKDLDEKKEDSSTTSSQEAEAVSGVKFQDDSVGKKRRFF